MNRSLLFLIVIFILSKIDLEAQSPVKKPASLMFLPDNSRLVSTDRMDRNIRIRNLQTGASDSITLPLGGVLSGIDGTVVTHNGSKIIITTSRIYAPQKNRSILGGGGDSIWKFEASILCYSLPGKTLLWKITTPGQTAYETLLVRSDDRVVCAIAHMGRNKFINLETGKETRSKCPFPNGDGRNIVQSPDGRFVLFWARPGFKTVNTRTGSKLKLWDFDNGKLVMSKFIRGKGVWSAVFKNDGKAVIAGSYNGSLQEWSLTNGNVRALLKMPEAIAGLSCSGADNNLLVVNSFRTDSLFVYSYPSMKPMISFLLFGDTFNIGGGPTPGFTFSKDGKYFAFQQPEGSIAIYRTDNWQMVRRLE